MRTYMWTSNISYCIFNVKPMLERSSRCKLDSFLVKVFSVLESLCILYPRTGDVSTALYRRQRLRNSTASGVALSNRAILFSVNHLELNNRHGKTWQTLISPSKVVFGLRLPVLLANDFWIEGDSVVFIQWSNSPYFQRSTVALFSESGDVYFIRDFFW